MSSPTNAFIERMQAAYTDLPDRLTPEAVAGELSKLDAWFRRVEDIKARYREGLIDRDRLPARARARGAAVHLVDETPAEAQAQLRLWAMSAEIIASRAKRSSLDLEEALSSSYEVFVRSLAGYDQEKGRLLSWLRSDLDACFRVLARDRHEEAEPDEWIESRQRDATTHSSAAGQLAELADPTRWAKTLTRSDEEMRALWDYYLSPDAPWSSSSST